MKNPDFDAETLKDLFAKPVDYNDMPEDLRLTEFNEYFKEERHLIERPGPGYIGDPIIVRELVNRGVLLPQLDEEKDTGGVVTYFTDGELVSFSGFLNSTRVDAESSDKRKRAWNWVLDILNDLKTGGVTLSREDGNPLTYKDIAFNLDFAINALEAVPGVIILPNGIVVKERVPENYELGEIESLRAAGSMDDEITVEEIRVEPDVQVVDSIFKVLGDEDRTPFEDRGDKNG